MRKIIVGLAVGAGMFTALSVHGFAENAGTPSQDFSAQMTNRLKQQLSWTDEQTQEIQDLFKNAAPSAPKTIPATPEERKAFFEAQKAKRAQLQTDISSVLTDEQRQKFQTLRDERKNNFENGRAGAWQKRGAGQNEGWRPEHRGRHRHPGGGPRGEWNHENN